jgi:hypothetical protein
MATDQPSRDAAPAGVIPRDLAAGSGSEVRQAHTGRRPGRGQEQVRAIPVTIVGGGQRISSRGHKPHPAASPSRSRAGAGRLAAVGVGGDGSIPWRISCQGRSSTDRTN